MELQKEQEMAKNDRLVRCGGGVKMKCRECKWMYSNETMDDLYICVNGNSENFGEYTGICCEDDCEDGESWYEYE